VIVFGVAVLSTAWIDRDLIRIKIASVYAPALPKKGETQAGPRPNVPFRGDAPWALSALPFCLTQLSARTGPLAYVSAHLPAGATEVVPPATLSYGNCTIFVRGDEAYVRRGEDRFRIPPDVRFYRSHGVLAVLRTSAKGGHELRVYVPTNP